MKPVRSLRLRAERLVELSSDQLAEVNGAAPPTLYATCLTCNMACMTMTQVCTN